MGVGTKIIVVYTVISVFFLMSGYVNPISDFMSNFVSIEYGNPDNIYNGSVVEAGNTSEKMGLSKQVGTTEVTGNINYLFNSWNPILIVWNSIKLIGSFVFCPVVFFNSIGAPVPIILILGVVPSILFSLSVIALIRGYDF